MIIERLQAISPGPSRSKLCHDLRQMVWGIAVACGLAGSGALLAGTDQFPLFDERVLIFAEADEVQPGDLDGDSDIDMLILDFNGLYWLENDGPDSTAWSQHVIADHTPTSKFQLVDVDGDFDLDVIGLQFQTVWWYENPGLPHGSEWAEHRIGENILDSFAQECAIVDIDADGDADIVSASVDGIRLYRNDGTGPDYFSVHQLSSQSPTSYVPMSMDISDVDGDQHLDIITNTGGVSWLRNLGSDPVQFAPEQAIYADDCSGFLGCRVRLVRRIDLNSDGTEDVLTLWLDPLAGFEFQWLVNNGQQPPSFSDPAVLTLGLPGPPIFSELLVADIDADGDDDFATINELTGGSPTILWVENVVPQAGIIAVRELFTSYASPMSLTLTDLDQDGSRDFVMTDSFAEMVYWYRQSNALNLDSQTPYARIGQAVAAAAPGDTILADPVLFDLEESLDDLGKGIRLQSRGDLRRGVNSTTTLSDGAALAPATNAQTIVAGTLTQHDGTAVSIEGDAPLIAGAAHITLGSSAFLHFPGASPDVAGTIEFGALSMLHADNDLMLSARPSFVEYSNIEIPAATLRRADLDGDGDEDLAAFGRYDDSVAWYELVDGPDGPTYAEHVLQIDSPFDGVDEPAFAGDVGAIHVTDIDLDGDLDILVGARLNAYLACYENDGAADPTFTPWALAFTTPADASTYAILAISSGDMNGDGDIDVVAASDAGLRIFHNPGDSQQIFHPSLLEAAGAYPSTFVDMKDMDADGDLDIVRYDCYGTNPWLVWYENDGNVQPSFQLRTIGDGFSCIREEQLAVVVDFDLDGDLDIVAADALATGCLQWYENSGESPPIFMQRAIQECSLNDSFRALSIDVADLDGDSDLDVVMSIEDSRPFRWFENQGGSPPTFVQRSIQASENAAANVTGPGGSIIATEVNGDGNIDLVTSYGDGFSNDLALFIATAPPTLTISSPNALLSVGGALRIDNKALRLAGSASASAAGGTTMTRTASLTGDSVLVSDLDSAGAIRPDLGGMFIIDGAYSQSADLGPQGVRTGRLVIPLSDGMLSALGVTGSATLAGSLRVEGVAPFDPAIGSSFDVLSAPAIIDRFDVALFPGFADGRYLRLEYDTSATSATSGTGARGPGDTVTVVVDTLGGEVDIDSGLDFTTGGLPTSAAVGDLDGDGLLDLAVTIPDSDLPEMNLGSVVILFNGGSTGGVWNGFASSAQVDVGINPTGIDIGEFDNTDGPDIAVANHGDNTVHILRNGGSGSFLPAPPTEIFLTGLEPVDVVAVDLDGDGFDDIAATTHAPGGSGLLSVRLNLGVSGSWDGLDTPRDFAALTDPTDVDPGDFDNDKDVDVDLAVANPFDGAVSVFVNLGGGVGANWQGFATRIDRDAGASPVAIDIVDLDLDGFSDIVASNAGDGTVSVILSEGDQNNDTVWDGSFIPSVELPVGDNARSIASADLDEDGDADLAIVADDDMGEPRVRVLRNDLTGGQLAFAPAQDVQTGAAPILVLAGDVDDDGADDLITVNQDTGGTQAQGPANGNGATRGPTPTNDVSVALNRFGKAPTICPGDANGDNIVNFTDLNMILGNFQQTGAPGIPGDLNGDGVVNITDLNIVLGNFQGSCS